MRSRLERPWNRAPFYVGASVLFHLALALALDEREQEVKEHVVDFVGEISVHVSVARNEGTEAPRAAPETHGARVPTRAAPRARTPAATSAGATEEVAIEQSIVTPEIRAPAISHAPPSAAAPSGETSDASAATGTTHADAGDGNAESASGVPNDADAVRAFVASVRTRVLARRRYPSAALERGLVGDVIVTVEIARDGSVRILSTDAANVPDLLVSAATSAIRDASPFPIPATVQRDVVRARLPIRFHLDPN